MCVQNQPNRLEYQVRNESCCGIVAQRRTQDVVRVRASSSCRSCFDCMDVLVREVRKIMAQIVAASCYLRKCALRFEVRPALIMFLESYRERNLCLYLSFLVFALRSSLGRPGYFQDLPRAATHMLFCLKQFVMRWVYYILFKPNAPLFCT
jgi:hypothetical protein